MARPRGPAVARAAGVAPPPGEHGGDGPRLAAALGVSPDEVLDLSMSVNPCAPDVAALARAHLGSLRRYPDATEAVAALAQAVGIPADRVVLTNGGSEAIAAVAAEVGAGWVEPPEFSLYARHLPVLRPGAGRWRSNPCNPTGELAAPGDEAAVWDEAFWPLATGTWTRGDADRGAWVVGSLTKAFACPGLRVGYVLCPGPAEAERARSRLPAWSVSGLACALVPALMASADLERWAAEVRRLRAELVGVLAGAGYSPVAADGPWALVPGAGDLRERLARAAVLVRDCTSFGLAGTVRVAVPDEPGLERVAKALST
ncbi:MAG: aminotransferase class I/II-fold pyridoxal phosphate-dependent enzyme [Actinomycetota bacterium]|jgi:histidinol-phosphate/aromatic aminotransferase/cobyric acid decarboxylase-like protein